MIKGGFGIPVETFAVTSGEATVDTAHGRRTFILPTVDRFAVMQTLIGVSVPDTAWRQRHAGLIMAGLGRRAFKVKLAVATSTKFLKAAVTRRAHQTRVGVVKAMWGLRIDDGGL